MLPLSRQIRLKKNLQTGSDESSEEKKQLYELKSNNADPTVNNEFHKWLQINHGDICTNVAKTIRARDTTIRLQST